MAATGIAIFSAPSLVSMTPAEHRRAFIRWREQRYNSAKRDIPFMIPLPDWLAFWIASGHYHQRGRRRGDYVMARFNDVGPYAIGNIKIVRVEDNIIEGSDWPRTPETRAKIARRLTGNQNSAGRHNKPSTLRKMRKAARERAQEGSAWLEKTRARNGSVEARRKNSEGVRAAWARRRAAEAVPS